ncbi:hypothetical protein C8R45DRAFT_932519 [Mycena sanguinolenta]|nr:hypothetical protein C8R45DRAFT_932519 [Mycena sanguinolenta]
MPVISDETISAAASKLSNKPFIAFLVVSALATMIYYWRPSRLVTILLAAMTETRKIYREAREMGLPFQAEMDMDMRALCDGRSPLWSKKLNITQNRGRPLSVISSAAARSPCSAALTRCKVSGSTSRTWLSCALRAICLRGQLLDHAILGLFCFIGALDSGLFVQAAAVVVGES